jgi:hypothetical protein
MPPRKRGKRFVSESSSDGVFLKAARIFRLLRHDSRRRANRDLPETCAESEKLDPSRFLTLIAAGNQSRLVSLPYKDAAR